MLHELEPKVFNRSKTNTGNNPWTTDSEFRIRIRDPRGNFVRGSYFPVPLHHVKFDNMDSGITLIMARRIGTTMLKIQSLAFNRNPISLEEKIWTPREARKWISDNKQYLMDFSMDLKDVTQKK